MNEKIKKVLRYISLYGVKRTLVKVVGRSRYSIIALPNFKHERFISFIGCGQFPFSTIAYFLYFGRKANFLGCYDINIDNSKSFHRFWNTLKFVGINQEFTHIATPEENAHIEAYHGIIKRDLFERYEYFAFGEVELLIKKYVSFYNNERLHGMLGKITPMEK